MVPKPYFHSTLQLSARNGSIEKLKNVLSITPANIMWVIFFIKLNFENNLTIKYNLRIKHFAQERKK